ncbi:MAG: DUF2207 domain-containing protein [Ruminococcus sp.]|nr:DUF2207 domain-containing protein [Candidatus Copronaster equi]
MSVIKKTLTFVLSIFILCLMSFSALASEQISYDIPEESSYDYSDTNAMSAEKYDVSIGVSDNNVLDVTESITINFKEYRHGIYRYLPIVGTIHRFADGEEIVQNYRMKISDVKVIDKNFETYTENSNLVIKMGDEETTVIGTQQYIIKYKCHLTDDKISSQDMLYWNFLPCDRAYKIMSSTLTVTMPKEFDSSKLEVLSGKYGQQNGNNFTVNVNGNTITAKTANALEPFYGATINLTLPEGYFTNELNYDGLWVPVIIVSVLSLAAVILLWLFLGRDKPVIPVVSFYPPENMTSAEIGYIIDSTVDNEDLVSLIIYWADKGYLEIIPKEKSDFTLNKLSELPSSAKSFEKVMFNGLFKSGDSVSSNDLEGTFYTTFAAAKSSLGDYFTHNDKRKLYTAASVTARIVSHILLLIPFAALIFGGSFIKANIINPILVITPCIFLLLSSISAAWNFDRRDAMSKLKRVAAIGFPIFISVVSAVILFLLSYRYTGNLIYSVGAFLFTAIEYFFMLIMKTLTETGVKWKGEVIGFRDFIKTAELDKLEMLVNENPSYFYNILPYAYALGLTDKWARQFEKIAVQPPVWYNHGYYGDTFSTVIFLNSFNRNINNVSKNMITPPRTSSSGFSGSGGGFSVGGGFSGGGFGGGGSGSW